MPFFREMGWMDSKFGCNIYVNTFIVGVKVIPMKRTDRPIMDMYQGETLQDD